MRFRPNVALSLTDHECPSTEAQTKNSLMSSHFGKGL